MVRRNYSFENTVFFDVDDTLVLWGLRHDLDPDIKLMCPYTNTIESAIIHQGHVQMLREHKMKGDTVIVWSQGGVKHAQEVLKALKVEEYVDLILEKPKVYYDDRWPQEFMGTRKYLHNVRG